MSASTVVITMILLQQSCFALLWAVFAVMRLARTSTLHWAAGTGFISCGMLFIAMRGELADALTYQGACALLAVGFIAMHRGAGLFARRRPADWENAAMLAIAALNLLCTLPGSMAGWPLAAMNLLMGWITVRTAWIIHRHLAQEFGASVSKLCAAPCWLMTAIFNARAVAIVLSDSQSAGFVHQASDSTLGTSLGFLVIGMLMNFGLVGVVLSRVLTRLRSLSERDALTGLYNRRSVEQRMAQEASRLARQGTPFSLLSIDIDHFKRINDRYGHPVGDQVLKAVAQALGSVGRGADLLARAGGEEFWLLLPTTSLSGATQLAERALLSARTLRFEGKLAEVRTTVSIGVVLADDPSEPIDSIMTRLDMALYRAKDNGRDRIELAEPRSTRVDDLMARQPGALTPPETALRPRATV